MLSSRSGDAKPGRQCFRPEATVHGQENNVFVRKHACKYGKTVFSLGNTHALEGRHCFPLIAGYFGADASVSVPWAGFSCLSPAAHDFDCARSMRHSGSGHAAKKQSLDAAQTARANQDHVSVPGFRFVDQNLARTSFFDPRRHVKACILQSLGGLIDHNGRTMTLLLIRFQECFRGQQRMRSDGKAFRIDRRESLGHRYEPHLGPFGPRALAYGSDCGFGFSRSVRSNQNPRRPFRSVFNASRDSHRTRRLPQNFGRNASQQHAH
jgi:hypothetical protein